MNNGKSGNHIFPTSPFSRLSQYLRNANRSETPSASALDTANAIAIADIYTL